MKIRKTDFQMLKILTQEIGKWTDLNKLQSVWICFNVDETDSVYVNSYSELYNKVR